MGFGVHIVPWEVRYETLMFIGLHYYFISNIFCGWCEGVYMPRQARRGQKTNFGSQFSTSTWGSGTELGFLGLAASTSPH